MLHNAIVHSGLAEGGVLRIVLPLLLESVLVGTLSRPGG